jgi:hypothetical protein
MPQDIRAGETQPSAMPPSPPAKASKLLTKIIANPKNDWEISDLETVSRQVGLACTSPTRGSHYKFSSPLVEGVILPIPHRKPVRVNYIKEFLRLVEAHQQAKSEGSEHA